MKLTVKLLLAALILPLVAWGQPGSAIRCNGSVKFATVPDNDALNTPQITIETWIKPNQCIGIDHWDAIINKPYTENDDPFHQWLLRRDTNGRVTVLFTVGGVLKTLNTGNNLIRLGSWSHLAATFDGDYIRIYFNGAERASLAAHGELTAYETNIGLGRLVNDDVDEFNGVIDEVRIWNYARSADEIAEVLHAPLSGDEDGLVGYYRLDEGDGQTIGDSSPTGNDGWLGVDVNEGNDDADWVESDAPIWSGIAEIAPPGVEFDAVLAGESANTAVTLRNLSQEDDQWHTWDFSLTDLGGDPDWFSFEPAADTLSAGEELEVTFTANTEGLEVGEYTRAVRFASNSQNLYYTELPVHLFVVEGFGVLHGAVTDYGTGAPIVGAAVSDDHFGYTVVTDENGVYQFGNMPAWTYDLTAGAADYLSAHTAGVTIGVGDDVTVDFELYYATCEPNQDALEMSLQADEDIDLDLRLANNGNGSLTWELATVIPEDRVFSPWLLRAAINAEQILSDNFIEGVVFTGDYFYICGAAGDSANKVYVLNRDGELASYFDQAGNSVRGFKDLSWDGELIWGSGERHVYGFDTAGDVVRDWDGPLDPNNAIAWDLDRELLWIGNDNAADIYGWDRDGNEVERLQRKGLRVKGLAYWPRDPDGYNLYIYHEVDSRRVVHKMNTSNNDTLLVREFGAAGNGRPNGAFVTKDWDPFNWVMMTVTNTPANAGGDRVDIHQLGMRTDWLSVRPMGGVINPSDRANLAINISAAELDPGMDLVADLVISHDGMGNRTVIPVAVIVSEPGGATQRAMRLHVGWNLVSVNVEPDAQTLEELLALPVEAGALALVKNAAGEFYWPDWGYNNIERWNGIEGYWIKMFQAFNVRVAGLAIPANTEIPLANGWNIVSYLPRPPVDAAYALGGLGEALVIAKEERGRFYLPAWEFNDIGDMMEGEGYQMFVDGDQTLVYQIPENVGGSRFEPRYNAAGVAWLNEQPRSSESHNLLLLTSLPAGTHITASTSGGIIAGRGIVGNDGKCGLTLWGDDPTTEAVEGFRAGETPILSVAGDLNRLDGSTAWTDGGWGVAQLGTTPTPTEFGLTQVYPNPFNSVLRINFTLAQESEMRLAVYDLTGRMVAELASGRMAAGSYRSVWHAGDVPSGIYMVKLATVGEDHTAKVLLLK